MRIIPLILLLIFTLSTAHAAKKAIVKANILRGESFVTANTSSEDIERIIKMALDQKGFQVIDEIDSDKDLFYVDVFVYQYPADFPTISMTIRTKDGIHFIDKEIVKLYADRNSANLKLASKLAERLPSDIDTNRFYEPTFNDLLSANRISMIGLTSNAITKSYRSNYSSKINWFDNEIPKFIIPNEFDIYMAYSSNYQGIRKQLKGKEIKLKLKINQKARFELIDIGSPVILTEKQKIRLKEFIDSFPLWINKNPIENVEMLIGIE
ncbi:hypothetical protein [Arcticibacter eurypsychrophilus]|uniref:hypothetical protein n=1 Tax=Arcticibacter eurypsychrophilus TaxID=1434752 RepID=UPI00084DA80D|nr:hypothetical protein [Arcticibacter eurypsychrophilus]